MSNKKLLKRLYALYLNRSDKNRENLGLEVQDIYKYFNPKNNKAKNKKLAMQLSRLCDMGYISINYENKPLYVKYIKFSPLMFYDIRQTKGIIITGILTIIAGISGTALGFVLNNSCATQPETKECPQAPTCYHTSCIKNNQQKSTHIYSP